jgi:NADH-ubiquinone oxidoreductase chain 5
MTSMVGLVTLRLASLSAIVEKDLKKLVALSTLRQLGLITFSLSLGRVSVCFFHICIHAFSKANLFLAVGGLIHSGFAQQDSRTMSVGNSGFSLTLTVVIRILGLIGSLFLSGFYSKEIILYANYFLYNRIISLIILVVVVRLTTTYCVKLLISFLRLKTRISLNLKARGTSVIPIIVLNALGLILGFLGRNNFNPIIVTGFSLRGLY